MKEISSVGRTQICLTKHKFTFNTEDREMVQVGTMSLMMTRIFQFLDNIFFSRSQVSEWLYVDEAPPLSSETGTPAVLIAMRMVCVLV